ncbi:hypothetical protein [Altericroceibacterium xinjiangense]|uniref:hypothetical protein n=1 Tax=Altericroceibacterium xinjiangense TaxID=762261 RepID=UPI000F7E4339|nr:hypothetical protein [Altericroceibacterium xinjiangense]
MKRFATLACIAAVAASPALADGRIGTLDRGSFTCELPGDAAGATGREQPDENFSIVSASRYQAARGGGTYLLTGQRLTMTSGPFKGATYQVESQAFLRKLDASGRPSRLRCVRS